MVQTHANALILAIRGVDAAENEPSKKFRRMNEVRVGVVLIRFVGRFHMTPRSEDANSEQVWDKYVEVHLIWNLKKEAGVLN